MADFPINDIVSQSAIDGFNKLKAAADQTVQSVEDLIKKGAVLNSTLGNITGIADMSKQLQQLTDLQKKLSEQEETLKRQAEDLRKAEAQLNAARAQSVASQNEQTAAAKKQDDAIGANIKTLNDYKSALANIKKEQKSLAQDYASGAISADQYARSLDKLAKQELQIKNVSQNLAGTLKSQVKEQQAASGSVEEYRAKLSLLQKTYDSLAATERNSAVGKQVKKELNGVNDQLSKLEAGTGRFQRNVGNYQSALSGVGTALGSIGLAIGAVSGIGDIFTKSLEEAEQAEKATSRFKNTLENIGKSDAFDRLSHQADNLAKSFGYIDNDDVTEVFNKLFTYGKLTEKQVRDLTPVIIDFAAKTGNSLSDSSDIIIKALEGNGKAVKTLGVDFKDTNSVSDRLGVVMTTLAGKVEGAGKAFGETLAGQVAIANQKLKDQEETLGNELAPVWTKVKVAGLTALEGIVQAITGATEKLKTFYNFLFDQEAYRQGQRQKGIDQALKDVDAINKEAEAYAQQFKTVKDLTKAYNDTLAAAKRNRDEQKAGNNSPLRERQNIQDAARLKAIETEIKLTKERNTLADKKDNAQGADKKEKDKFFDQEIKDQIEAQKNAQKLDAVFVQDRLDARKKQYDLELKLSDEKYKTDIANADGNAKEIAFINKAHDYEKLKAATEYNQAIIKINDEYKAEITKSEDEITKQFLDDIEKKKAAQFAFLSSQRDSSANRENERRDTQLLDLESKRAQGLVSEKEYAKQRIDIEQKSANRILDIEIGYAEQLIDLQKSYGQDTSKAEADLAKLKVDRAKQTNDQIKKSDQERYEESVKLIDKISDYYNQASAIVGSLIQNNVDAQKNAIQDQIDKLDEQKNAEIEAVNASTASAQDKADQIAIINARAQAKKEELERRQRRLDEQRAKFEKQQALFSILLNTARGVTAALASVPPNIPEAILIGVLGAAQLAVAAAQPIPKFAHGTLDAPGGPSVVGDAGKHEYVVTPEGNIVKTPNVPTVMNVPAHSIVYPDHESMLRATDPQWGGSVMSESNGFSDQNMVREMRAMRKAIERKPDLQLHEGKRGWELIKNGRKKI